MCLLVFCTERPTERLVLLLSIATQHACRRASPADGSTLLLPAPSPLLCRIKRQARVRGLSLVDLNHPQHTTAVGLTPKKLSAALSSAGLAAGAVCLRFPAEEYALGAFSNPDPAVRAKAVQLDWWDTRYLEALVAASVLDG